VIGTLVAAAQPRVAAIGHAVGLAKRIEALATPGSIFLSAETARLVGRGFQLLELGLFEVRGAGAPLALFELLGPEAVATRERQEPLELVAA
jgi:class 3 adenylate cyclase